MSYPKVHLREEVMREGMQIESIEITVDEKVGLLQGLAECGLEAINVGSFVSPHYTPQMANIEAVLRQFKPAEGTSYYALTMNQRGLDRAAEFSWLSPVNMPPSLNVHLCDTFVRRNMNRSQDDEIASWPGTVARAVAAEATSGGLSLAAAWGSNFQGVFTVDQRMAMLRREHELWEAAGIPVTFVRFADPMSWCMPHWVEETLAAVIAEWPEINAVHLHLHDARAMALPSMYAAIRALDESFNIHLDTTAGGIGGCPYCGNGRATGMAATEDVVSMCSAMGIETGVDLGRLIEFVSELDRVIGRPSPGRTSKAGPLPMRPDQFYDANLPLIETYEEAQHFRFGESVVKEPTRPWKEPIPDGLRLKI